MNHLTSPLVIHIIQQFLNILNINIEINKNLNLGIYNTYTFQPISTYIKNILGLEYDNDTIGNDFYINYFKDYCNNMSNNELSNKYTLYENYNIYNQNII